MHLLSYSPLNLELKGWLPRDRAGFCDFLLGFSILNPMGRDAQMSREDHLLLTPVVSFRACCSMCWYTALSVTNPAHGWSPEPMDGWELEAHTSLGLHQSLAPQKRAIGCHPTHIPIRGCCMWEGSPQKIHYCLKSLEPEQWESPLEWKTQVPCDLSFFWITGFQAEDGKNKQTKQPLCPRIAHFWEQKAVCYS